MSTFTENYNLIKPSAEDYYDVSDFNENMDFIDAQFALSEQAMERIDGKIGTPEGNETIFSLLRAGDSSKAYKQSETVQKTIGSVSSISTNTTLKLTSFTAKYSGTILLSIKYTYATGGYAPQILCHDHFNMKFLNLGDGTLSNDSGIFKGTEVCSLTLSPGTNITQNFIVPVEQGKTYIFDLNTNNTSNFSLSLFKICYDVVSTEEL